jgi:magnesium-transporting ATPase (P-type)
MENNIIMNLGKIKPLIFESGLRKASRSLILIRGGSSVQSSSSSSTSTSMTAETSYYSDDGDPHSFLAMSCAHWMTKAECLHNLRVDESTGLSKDEAALRRSKYGSNALKMPSSKPLWHLIKEQFQDRLVQILLGVAALSSFLAAIEKDPHAITEPLIIVSILVINAAVGVWQSKSAEDSLEALKKLQPETACVLRNGLWQGEFPASDLVPGDIIYLRVGDKVPADAR